MKEGLEWGGVCEVGAHPVRVGRGTFYFYLLLSKVVSLLQLTSDCVLLQWGRIQKQPPPSSNEAPGKETERGTLSRCHFKKSIWRAFFLFP